MKTAEKTPKIGRPKLPSGTAKSLTLRARVSPGEFTAVETAARKSGLAVSEWTRTVLLSAARN